MKSKLGLNYFVYDYRLTLATKHLPTIFSTVFVENVMDFCKSGNHFSAVWYNFFCLWQLLHSLQLLHLIFQIFLHCFNSSLVRYCSYLGFSIPPKISLVKDSFIASLVQYSTATTANWMDVAGSNFFLVIFFLLFL